MTKEEPELLSDLGKNIKWFRHFRGLTQRALASKVGTQQHFLSAIEKGKQNITVLKLNQIACALDIPIEELIKPHDVNSISSCIEIIAAKIAEIQESIRNLEDRRNKFKD